MIGRPGRRHPIAAAAVIHNRRERRHEQRYEDEMYQQQDAQEQVPVYAPAPAAAAAEAVAAPAGTSAKCQYAHCEAVAAYGYADEPSVIYYCEKHKGDDMVLLVEEVKTCEFVRCKEPATHGFSDENVARYCKAHGSGCVEISAPAADSAMPPAPPVQATSSSLSPEALAALLSEYEAASAQLGALASAGADASNNAPRTAEATNKAKHFQQELSQVEHAIAETTERLQRQNSKPSLGGRSLLGKGLFVKDEEKCAALEAEIKKLQEQKAVCEAKLDEARLELGVLQSEGAQLASKVQTQQGLERRQQEIYKQVVDSERQPAALTGARRSLSEVNPQMQQIEGIIHGIQQADAHLQRALAMQEQALRGNMGGAIMMGPGETIAQARRDRATQESEQLAGAGARQLADSLSQIPPSLVQKYPAQLEGCRSIEIPKLWVGHFGRTMAADLVLGPMGETALAMKNAQAIRDNMAVLQQCRQIAAEQRHRLEDVGALLQAEKQQLQRQVRDGEVGLFQGAQARASVDGVTAGVAKIAVA